MQNPRLTGRYAKSLLDLAKEQNQLDAVYDDVLYLQSACRASRDLVVMLKSPVITADRKLAVLSALMKDKVTNLTSAFASLLVRKGREVILPEILTAFIQQYKDFNKIQVIKLKTATAVSEELKQTILSKVRSVSTIDKIDLQTEIDPSIIGGFVLEVGDQLIDASISHHLQGVKQQFRNNDFIYNIR